MITNCELRRRFRACGQAGIAICQYCGRSFCEEHGARLRDGQEICSRPICAQKRADLEEHTAYKQAVAQRNAERSCGREGCERQVSGQCSKCAGLFCAAHLDERAIEERRGATVVRVWGSLCPHCAKRRRLWSKS